MPIKIKLITRNTNKGIWGRKKKLWCRFGLVAFINWYLKARVWTRAWMSPWFVKSMQGHSSHTFSNGVHGTLSPRIWIPYAASDSNKFTRQLICWSMFFFCMFQAICVWYLATASAQSDVSSAASTLGGMYREARDAYYRSPSDQQERPQSRCISCLYAAMGGGGNRDDRDDR